MAFSITDIKELAKHTVKRGAKISIVLFTSVFLYAASHFAFAGENKKWSGVDETVVEKVAKEHGRSAWTPFINTDQGDLLLFVFLIAGAAGGFIMGYNFRKLFVEKKN